MKGKNKLLVLSILLALIAGFVLGIPVVESAQTRQILETSLSRIEAPAPDEILHFSYVIYQRTPPSELEPKDPYHRPYSDLWVDVKYVDEWIQVGSNGNYTWYRYQIRNEDGELLQDILYKDGIGTNYDPFLGIADRREEKEIEYFDERAAAIEFFLDVSGLTRKEGTSPTGEQVISIYSDPQSLEGSPLNIQPLEEALQCWWDCGPFVADIQPVSRAIRVDFSPKDLTPIGRADVVWDADGNEYWIAYHNFAAPEVVTAEEVSSLGLLDLEVPEAALSGEWIFPVEESFTELEKIKQQVEFGLYLFSETVDISLVSSTISKSGSLNDLPPSLFTINNASALGLGVNLIYADETDSSVQSKRVITLIEGDHESLSNLLRQTSPDWVTAKETDLQVGSEVFTAWTINLLDPNQLCYVIEAGETLIYVRSVGISENQLLQLFSEMILLK